MHPHLSLCPEVAAAMDAGCPVVALESTLIAHGLPRPSNLETARAAEAAVRSEEAIPATIAVLGGRLRVGLTDAELARLAEGRDVLKASRRDLAAAIAQRRDAATTVAATMFIASLAGIRLFATGGIGGVHRGAAQSFDISADLTELARTPVCVVCAGAKSILDIPMTLEYLESHGVPVVGYGSDEFPAFYVWSSGLKLDTWVSSVDAAAAVLWAHWSLGGAGVVLAQPPPTNLALDPAEFNAALARAESEAEARRITGKALTPFLLARVAEHTGGRALKVNQALVIENARLAARVAKALAACPRTSS